MSKLSELEGAVLGLVWQRGPLTAYAIRKSFLDSRSSHFSGSSGAIYPLVERVAQAGYVVASDSVQGKRKSKQYEITALGRKALDRWLTPVESGTAAVEFDPIRTRVHFLGSLSASQRQQFLSEVAAQLRTEMEATRKLIEQLMDCDDQWRTWGARRALAVLAARLAAHGKLTEQFDAICTAQFEDIKLEACVALFRPPVEA